MFDSLSPDTAVVALARRGLLAASAFFVTGRAWSMQPTTAATSEREAFVVLPGQAPRFSGPQGREADFTELLATSKQTGGTVGLFRQTIAPKSGPPTHYHRTEDEFFYAVSGEFKFRLGDNIVDVAPHSVVFVPRGTVHTFMNAGTDPSIVMIGVTPGGFEMMFAERQGVDAKTNQALMEKYNMVVVGPPLR